MNCFQVRSVTEARTRLESARNKTQQADAILRQLRRAVSSGSKEASRARASALLVQRQVQSLLHQIQEENRSGTTILRRIQTFLSNPDRVTSTRLLEELEQEPDNVSINELSIRETADQIRQLSEQHASSISRILDETQSSRTKAEALMNRGSTSHVKAY